MSTLKGPGPANPAPWPDPTPAMLADPAFEAIWQVIKSWDINVPSVYAGYCGATGNHVRAILDGLTRAGYSFVKPAPPDPSEAKRRAGVGNKDDTDPAGPWARAFEKNMKEALDENAVLLRQSLDVVRANQFLAGLEAEYANYSEVELKLVDPRTVTHITRDQRQNLSEVMDAPAALAVIVTQKNHTATPVYYPLKLRPNRKQLAAIKEHFAQALEKGSVKMIAVESDG